MTLIFQQNVYINPNGVYTYWGKFTPPSEGAFKFWICNYRTTEGWSASYPASANPSYLREQYLYVSGSPKLTSSLSLNPSSPKINEPVTASFTIRNDGSQATNLGTVMVAVRGPQGQDKSFAPDYNVTIQPGQTYTYNKTMTSQFDGMHNAYIVINRPGIGWSVSYPQALNNTIVRKFDAVFTDNNYLTSSLSLNPSSPKINEPVTASFTIRNDGSQATNLGTVMVAVRGPQGQDKSFAPDYNVTIQPGQTYTYNKTMTSQFDGMHNAYIVINRPGIGWSVSYPQALNNTIVRKFDAVFTDNNYLTSSLSLNPSSPKINEPVTASFTIRNDGSQATNLGTVMVAVRGPQGQDKSFAPDYNVTIQPGQTYTYNKTMTSQFDGMHNAYIVINRPGIGWSVSYPQALNNTIVRKFDAVFTR
jgi:L-lactate utilization protein LutC